MTLEKAILATLAYSDHFSFPLTFDEIYSRLISVHTSHISLRRQLNYLIKAGKIESRDNYYFFPGRSSLIHKRVSAQKLSQKLLKKTNNFSSHLSQIPGIVAIFLTGSLSVGNAKKRDDIDFLIITKPGLLWTTRLIVTLYTTILGIRRTPRSSHFSGKLCLNLYLTSDNLIIPESRRSLYTAYELVQATPLFDPLHSYEQLLCANDWLHHYLPNYQLPNTNKRLSSQIPVLFLRLFESLAFCLQFLYMYPRITREYITRDAAFFHPLNPGSQVISKLSKLYYQ